MYILYYFIGYDRIRRQIKKITLLLFIGVLLTEIIFALWLGLIIFYKEYRPKFTPISIALFIFIAIISLSIVFGSDWRMSLWSDESRTLGLVSLWHFFVLFLITSSLQKRINWQKLLILSFGTAVLVSLIGISQLFIVFSKESNVWLHIVYHGFPGGEHLKRIDSTFSNSAFMAGYLLFNFFIGLWLILSYILHSQNKILKDIKFWFLGMGAILIAIAIFLSQTIGVILGLGIGIFALLLYFAFAKSPMNADEKLINTDNHPHKLAKIRINQRSQKFSIGLLIFILIFSGIFWLTRDNSFWQKIPGLNRIASASFESASIRDRLIAWQISLRAFKEKPVLGWGFENFRIAFNKHYDPKILTKTLSGSYWDKPHNILLEYLTTTGILGLLAYLGIFAAAFYSIIKFKKFRVLLALFLSVTLISYFIQNIFVFDTIGTYLMFFLILAFVDNQFKKTKTAFDSTQINNKFQFSPKFFPIVISVFLLICLVPIYYNYQIFNASRYEYWGVNYFLNQLTESSLVSFSEAVNTPTPYIDDIRKNFASTVKQAYQQDIKYPNLTELQAKLAEYLELVIKNHPEDFFNYIALAEFKNIFFQYNPNYLNEAEVLSQKALELSPKRQQVYYVLAKTKLLKGDTRGAYEIFEKVVSINPESADPHFFFGLMSYGLGDSQRGAEEIALAAKFGRFPRNVEELIALGNFVGDYHQNYKESIKLYNMALSELANLPRPSLSQKANILLKLAIAYYFDENKEMAKSSFLELKKLVDIKTIPIYPDLQPILQELGIN